MMVVLKCGIKKFTHVIDLRDEVRKSIIETITHRFRKGRRRDIMSKDETFVLATGEIAGFEIKPMLRKHRT